MAFPALRPLLMIAGATRDRLVFLAGFLILLVGLVLVYADQAGQNADLASELQAQTAAVSSLEKQVASLTPKNGANEDVAALDGRLADSERQLIALGSRFAALEAKYAAFSEQLALSEGRFAALNATLAEMEGTSAAQGARLAEFEAASAVLETRVENAEAHLTSLADAVQGAGRKQAERAQAIEASLTEVRQLLAAITSREAERAAASATPPAVQVSTQSAYYEQSVQLAFQTLDAQFQLIRERLHALSARDKELEQAQEATLVAVQTDLNAWREQHSPPIWDMAAQLSGTTIRFAESNRYADPGAAETALQQVTSLLLASDPSLGVRVVGYADFDGPDAKSNRITSQKRANEVMAQLERLGVPPERLLAVGRSTEDRAIDSDIAGNANRRVIFEPFLLKDAAPPEN